MMNSDTKIEISIGCAKWMTETIEQNRRRLEIVEGQNNVMHNFFELVNRLGGPKVQGYGEDRFYQAKKEIDAAIDKVKK